MQTIIRNSRDYLHVCRCIKFALLPTLLNSEGTHSSKFDMIDTRRKSSFAVEPEASIKYGVGGTAEETASIKLGEDLNVKLNGNHNSAEARDENELLAVVMVTFEVEDSLSSGSLDGQEEIVKEGSEDGNNGQQGQENEGFGHGLTCAVANSGEQQSGINYSNAGSTIIA